MLLRDIDFTMDVSIQVRGQMAVSVEQAQITEDAVPDLRRPGRKGVSPALIQILRSPVEDGDVSDNVSQLLDEDGMVDAHPLAPARGIAVAIVLSVPIWAAMLGAAYAALK